MELLGPYGQIEYEAPYAPDRDRWLGRMLAASHRRRHQRDSRQVISQFLLSLPKG
jgi:hypothetical protein